MAQRHRLILTAAAVEDGATALCHRAPRGGSVAGRCLVSGRTSLACMVCQVSARLRRPLINPRCMLRPVCSMNASEHLTELVTDDPICCEPGPSIALGVGEVFELAFTILLHVPRS